jgi:hypothetical protein
MIGETDRLIWSCGAPVGRQVRRADLKDALKVWSIVFGANA